jgi:hypothetical protein
LRRGWWNAQEERALRLNSFVAKILDEFPDARRATITSPACNGLTCPTVWASREQRTFGNALFVNLARIPFLLGEAELEHMAAEIALAGRRNFWTYRPGSRRAFRALLRAARDKISHR